SSTTSGSACLMRARTRARVLPRQSPSSLIRASISPEGDSGLAFVAAGFVAGSFLAFPFWTIGLFLPLRLTILEYSGGRSPARPPQFRVSPPSERQVVSPVFRQQCGSSRPQDLHAI